MRFAILFLFFAQLATSMAFATDKPGSKCGKTIARAADAWKKTAAVALGGRNSCEEIKPAEVQQLSCKNEITVNALQLSKLGSYLTGEWAEEGVFQIVAGRSERKALCRNTTFENYLKVPAKTQLLDQKAQAKFDEAKEEMQRLFQYKQELADEHRSHALGAADGRTSGHSMQARKLIEEKMQDVDEALALTAAGLPMGAEPEIARAYVQMARGGNFDQNLFRQGMAQAQQKYLTAIKYYFDHSQPLGNGKSLYCLDEPFRKDALKSGAAKHVLEDVLADNSRLGKKLDCRFEATYKTGAQRVQVVGAGVMLASLAFWSAEIAAVKGYQLASAATSASGFATASQSISTIVAVSQIQMACTNDENTTLIATQAGLTCDPEEEFKKVIHEIDNSYCNAALLWNSTYLAPWAVKKAIKIAPHVIDYMKKATAAVRARLSPAQVEVTSVMRDSANPLLQSMSQGSRTALVLAMPERRAKEIETMRAQGYLFKNPKAHIEKGEPLELAGNPNGNEFSQLIYNLEVSGVRQADGTIKEFNRKITVKGDLDALGTATGNTIEINRTYLLTDRQAAIGTLLHEVKHNSSNRLTNEAVLDRVMEFRSLDFGVPVRNNSYQLFMRADEYEARLTQIAKLKNQNRSIDVITTTSEAENMARAQINVLKKIKDADRAKGKLLFSGSTTDKVSVPVMYQGKMINVEFTVPKGSHNAAVKKQIDDRIAYLERSVQELHRTRPKRKTPLRGRDFR